MEELLVLGIDSIWVLSSYPGLAYVSAFDCRENKKGVNGDKRWDCLSRGCSGQRGRPAAETLQGDPGVHMLFLLELTAEARRDLQIGPAHYE